MRPEDVWEIAQAILLSVGGSAIVVVALSSWIGKLWAKRILEQEAFTHAKELEQLRGKLADGLEESKAALAASQAQNSAELEHRIYVSKAQFDLEFKLYQELWNKVETMRADSIKFWIPLRDTLAAGPLTPARIGAALIVRQDIADKYQAFIEYYLSQSPFIARSVKHWLDANAATLGAISGIAMMALDAATSNSPSDFTLVEEAQLQFNTVHAGFANVIRDRIASLSIVA
jgi:hypothetical protein